MVSIEAPHQNCPIDISIPISLTLSEHVSILRPTLVTMRISSRMQAFVKAFTPAHAAPRKMPPGHEWFTRGSSPSLPTRAGEAQLDSWCCQHHGTPTHRSLFTRRSSSPWFGYPCHGASDTRTGSLASGFQRNSED